MYIDLTEQEREELIAMVENAVAKIPIEIHHTDSRQFRKHLREREDTLKAVLDRLQAADE